MNRLKELRQAKKLTQQELADYMQITRRGYQKWESGESQIRPGKAKKLADFFGVSISVLLGYRSENDSLGFRLWSLRNQKGIELEKAASDLKLSVDELKLIEQTDNAELDNTLAKDFADYYNVSVGYLLGYENDLRFRNEIVHDIDGASKKYGDYLPALNKRLSEEGLNIDKFDEETSKLIDSINEKLIKIRFIDLLRVHGYIDSILEKYDSN